MKIINHKTYKDNRGSYTAFNTHLEGIDWDQCSVSINEGRYTFRGLHYQTNPAQTKYIKVVQGSIIDFLVDLDTKEVKYIKLDTKNDEGIVVPDNYAHGFLTLEPNTIVVYLVKGDYNPDSEHSIVWDTVPEVKAIIDSYTSNVIISEKDKIGK